MTNENIDTAAARILAATKWGRGQMIQTPADIEHYLASQLLHAFNCEWASAVAAARRALAAA